MADSNATSKCTLWEETIGTLHVGKLYLLKNFVVHEYASQILISTAKQGSEIVPTQDIGNTASDDDTADDSHDCQNTSVRQIIRAAYAVRQELSPSTPHSLNALNLIARCYNVMTYVQTEYLPNYSLRPTAPSFHFTPMARQFSTSPGWTWMS